MRIVSLCPSLTELVCELGGSSDLVGRTRFCVHPSELAGRVPALGGTKDPDVPRVVALAPDLVLMNSEENRRADHDALVGAGLACAAYLPKRPEDVPGMVRDVAGRIDRGPAGEALARGLEERAAGVRSRAVGAGRSFATLVWRRPWMAVGGDTYVHALVALTGARNVLADSHERYPTVDAAELGRRRPDVVLLPSEPFPFAERHLDELCAATGLERERFLLADGSLLTWHGSRTLAGLAYVEELLAPRT